jgi:hypothetical protein
MEIAFHGTADVPTGSSRLHSSMRSARWLMISLLVLGLCASVFGADITAKIRGTVYDPAGAVVPNVPVTATNQQTGVVYNATSSANGSYQFLQLPVGTYMVTAAPSGFRKFSASGIVLTIDQNYVQDIHLQLGQTSETVEVSANPSQVDTTNIQLNNVINSTQIVELPLIGRNWTQLEQTFPGVQASNDRFGTFSANGSQTQQTSFLVNGTDVNDAPLNTAVVIPSPDAIQQFTLVTSSLNPEYSRNSGAIVTVNIKNGTNQYHGDAFDFYRDTFLNTPNYFQTKGHGGAGAPKFHQNLFGGTLGGPVLKDKLFFFLSYQGNRSVTPQAGGTVNVFSPANRGGDFTLNSSTGKPNVFSSNIIPASITVPGCAAGSTWKSCASTLGNKFPTSAYNPISAKLLSTYVPLPTQGTQFTFNPTTNVIQDQGIMRFDYNKSTANQFWFVGIIQHAPSIDTLPFTGSTLPGFGENAQRETHQFTADYTHTFNSTTLNDFRVGYTRFNFAAVLPNEKIDPASLGFNIKPQAPQYAQVPTIAVSGLFTLGFSTNGPQPRKDQNYQVDDNVSKVWGNHTLKFGWDGRRFNVDNPFFATLNGSYSFNTSSSTYTTGDPGLDFLLGVPATYSQGSGAIINAHAYENYFYGQDQWKVRPNLTLTFGGGWQIDTPWYNTQYNKKGVTCFIPGQQSAVFPTVPKGLNYPGDPGCTNGQGAKTSWKHIGPRVGFAYAPTLGFLSAGDEHKLSIRGGYGIYFNRTEEEGSLQNLEDPPFGLSSAGAQDLGGSPAFANPFADINRTPGLSEANKFPAAFATPPGTGIDWTNYFPTSLSQYNSKYTMPYSQNFNLTVERELGSQIIATVSYVGSLGRHEQIELEGNPITQAGHDACLASASCIANRSNQSFLFPTHTATPVVDARFGSINVYPSIGLISSTGNSSYNSLQVSAKKNFTHGLLFQASYTWSHSLDNGSGFEDSGFGGAHRGFNMFNPALNYGDSSFDARQRFVFAPVYQIPDWKNAPGLHWLPSIIGKGWGISGAMTFASGFPFDIRTSGSRSLFCSSNWQFYACPEVPVQTAGLKRVDPRNPGIGASGQVFWFDPNVGFSDEPIGGFGNVHRNPFHGPGINNTDVAISKNIYFVPGHENYYMQLRLESYNVYNHTQFSNPSGSVTFAGSSTAVGGSGGTVNNTFGRITSAAAGRQSQLAIKIYF